MRSLGPVRPTPEQLSILSDFAPGTIIVRGAAGSGKTTTAVLRLHSLLGSFENRRRRMQLEAPVRALVLTFNRTLRGYIEDLVYSQAGDVPDVDLEVSTFGRWARTQLDSPLMIGDQERRDMIKALGSDIALEPNFLCDETEYALGRFLPGDLPSYITARRLGRGNAPRVDTDIRRAILRDVIVEYTQWKSENMLWDWNDLAVHFAQNSVGEPYDIIIADECQDFSANELRAIRKQLKQDHSLTLIIDSVQRIYARGHRWAEVGLSVRPENVKLLQINYRNTIQIARFAAPLVAGVPIDEDGTLPNFSRTTREGRTPVLLEGRFREQMTWAIRHIEENVDLAEESVAFLHPLGGGWFSYVRDALAAAGLDYIELSQQSDWPVGDENIGLSTLYSAKGLEFDHVFILGLNEDTMRLVEGDEDREHKLRRLLAVGIGRAKEFVCLGYSPSDPARILTYLDASTYQLIRA
jgi:superfamily I DNA/RNA helicase